jgi:hypothetical protein
VIQELITRLVREAPALDPAVCEQLVDELRANGAPLAVAIARVVELLALDLAPSREGGEVDDRERRAQRVDPGIALPPLAMACATLLDPALTAHEHEAARYEIETLLPVPDRPVKPAAPLVQLTRGPRPRT